MLYLLRLSGAIIRFGERSRFLICGVLSRNLALDANSMILSMVRLILAVNSSFIFMVFFENISLLTVLKYLHLYSIWKDVSRQFGHTPSLLLYNNRNIDCMQGYI